MSHKSLPARPYGLVGTRLASWEARRGSGVSSGIDTRRNGRGGFSWHGLEKCMSARIDTLSNAVDASGDGRRETFGGMRGPECRMDRAGRPLGVSEVRIGTEFAGGLPTFRRTRRRVRASGPLGRRVAVRRGTCGCGWAGGVYLPVVAWVLRRWRRGRARVRRGERPLDATPGPGHCLGLSETLNRYPR